MKFLQKLGKALMLPVAVLPICGILMGIGYYLCPATMQGGDIEGVRNLIGLFLVKAGGALIDNMAILFVIGVGVGMSDKNDGTGGIAALASWLMMTTLLSTGFVTTIMPSIADSATKTLAFDKIQNPFIGILAGIIGSLCYNRFKDTKLPDWLSFFSGKRCVAIIAGVVAKIFLFLRPSGTSPATIRCASPSMAAVLPTPGSPMRTGLFLVLRERIRIIFRISISRPITGSSFWFFAFSTRSSPYLFRVS